MNIYFNFIKKIIKTDQPGVDLKQENTDYEQGEKRFLLKTADFS